MDAHRVIGRYRAIEKRPALVAGVLLSQSGEGPPFIPKSKDVVLERGQVELARDRRKRARGALVK
jgi:hypothetical protein